MPLQRYSNKEPLVFVWVMIPYTIGLNTILFGSCIFLSFSAFFRSFCCSVLYLSLVYFVFGLVAVLVQKRLPGTRHMARRIILLLPVFYLLNGLAMSGGYWLYNQFPLVQCPIRQGMFFWAIAYGCTMSTIITLLNEGFANWEAWKNSLVETEKLKNLYQRSKVLGLQGQINPHFLFNCFNTLSGLIQEDPEKAEAFLDEMTKVHRYLLRSEDERFVPVETELNFAASYLFLASERFGEAIAPQMVRDAIPEGKCLPPFSLQIILEHIIYDNALSKSDPLTIAIRFTGKDTLEIRNSIRQKAMVQAYQLDDGIQNLIHKYRMLNKPGLSITEQEGFKVFVLPLFDQTESTL